MTYEKSKINTIIKEFSGGAMSDAYKVFGCHKSGDNTEFLVWAPNAESAYVKLGKTFIPMEKHDSVWFASVEGVCGEYRFVFESDGVRVEKNDPFAFSVSEKFMSEFCDFEGIVCNRMQNIPDYLNIYELHVGSWLENGSFVSIAQPLAEYVLENGYNYIELMPVNFHPCGESWGYQTGGYYALQYGSPSEFAYFINKIHENGIGVIVDWVPGHFACDSFGLSLFDGFPLFESEDNSLSENRLWGTVNTDFSKPEVCSFMLSSACYFTDVFGVDGIRVDAVSNMLLKRFEGYRMNTVDGDINYSAIEFLKNFNREMKKRGVITIAEDTACGISATRPLGLGFDRIWNMGWFHDMFVFLSAPPCVRSSIGGYIMKPFEYMNNERYILPLSHDENVHGKNSVFGKIYDDNGRSYRILLALMTAFPGDKLHFSGCEIVSKDEWDGRTPAVQNELSSDVLGFVRMLNSVISHEKSLQSQICEADRLDNGVLTFIRSNPEDEDDFLIFVFNFTDTGYDKYYIGIDRFADFEEIFVTSGERECRRYSPEAYGINNRNFRTEVNLPPLCGLALRPCFTGKKS